ncbi:MAG: phosphoribosylamine--glycine ligase [Erysipelotrichaceae bacterium]|nr:phosphoribosylamine--glycine ligase [Erysipelotrichaceae bacterium]MDY5251743.1 phosphoribosylamine--glycine ligase [Erysipelotrichaceae bacterium]
MAKVLVIGSGGREHAIAYKFKNSPSVDEVYVAPGNPGMGDVATIVDIKMDDYDKLVSFCKEKAIDLVFVGPEIPLCDGIVDELMVKGINVFGPTKAAARLEGSKVFSKMMMKKYAIPTAKYESFDDFEKAKAYLLAQSCPIVIKADGLAAGKGVVIPQTQEEALKDLEDMMCNQLFKEAGKNVVIEEYLEGEEFSLLAFVKNDKVYGMQLAQDHKRAYDNDEGLNTGGMGAYTPVNHLPQSAYEEAMEKIMKPMAKAMVDEGCPFTGVLYGGCMLTKDGVKTIEFNVRFGDPETEVILLALQNDLYTTIMDILADKEVELKFDDQKYLGVVMANKGYPQSYEKGAIISGLNDAQLVFHMGTAVDQDGNTIATGGRVLFVVGKGDTLKQAKENAYANVSKIKCDTLFYRHDIGDKGLKHE